MNAKRKGQALFIRDQQFECTQRRMRIRGFLWATVLSLVVLLAVPTASFAQSALTDDADTQKGKDTSLALVSGSNVYLKFKLSSTLPNGTAGPSVARATIKLYIDAVKSPGCGMISAASRLRRSGHSPRARGD